MHYSDMPPTIAVTEKEKLLLRMLFQNESCTQENVDRLTEGLDPDEAGMEYLLLLGLLGARQERKMLPSSVRGRIEGVYRYTRVKNLRGFFWLQEKIRLFAAAGIPVMPLKGMAMKAYYAPDSTRQMMDFDLAVPGKDFEKARTLLISSGCEEKRNSALHAVDFLEEDNSLDLHRWIFKTHADYESDIWDKAVRTDIQGLPVLVLNPMDMIIHIADNKARDIIRSNQTDRKLKWLFDLRSIIQKEGRPDWKEIADRAKQMEAYTCLTWILPIFSQVFPEMLSSSEYESCFPRDADYIRWHRRIEKYRKENASFLDYQRKHPDKKLTPIWVMKVIRRHWCGYRWYYGPELKKTGEITSFREYFYHSFHVNSMGELIRKYTG